jgi:hypothetical protein
VNQEERLLPSIPQNHDTQGFVTISTLRAAVQDVSPLLSPDDVIRVKHAQREQPCCPWFVVAAKKELLSSCSSYSVAPELAASTTVPSTHLMLDLWCVFILAFPYWCYSAASHRNSTYYIFTLVFSLST